MGFWESKLNQMRPPEPQPSPAQNVAPGAWWQGQAHPPNVGTRLPPQRTVEQQQRQRPGPDPADLCPRCGSDAYVEFHLDVSEGGAIDPRVGPMRKQCFNCRYPHFNASGNIASGKGAAALKANGAKIQTLKTKQFIGGRTEAEIFSTAVNVDGAM
jgi:hypothetical protein